jgi:hypothetical protein
MTFSPLQEEKYTKLNDIQGAFRRVLAVAVN